jgi:hypothetical protein
MFKATFNNVSAILWRSVVLVEETGIPEENHQPSASHFHTQCYHSLKLANYWMKNYNTPLSQKYL